MVTVRAQHLESRVKFDARAKREFSSGECTSSQNFREPHRKFDVDALLFACTIRRLGHRLAAE